MYNARKNSQTLTRCKIFKVMLTILGRCVWLKRVCMFFETLTFCNCTQVIICMTAYFKRNLDIALLGG